MKKILLASLVASACVCAQASSDFAIYGSAGTGYGLGMIKPVSESWNVRADYTSFVYDKSTISGQIQYDAAVRLRDVAAYSDYKPFGGNSDFRMTAGIVHSNSGITMTGSAAGGNFVINGVTVPAAGEYLNARIKMPSTRPYLGIGWGMANLNQKGWMTGLDLGVMIGRPTVEIDASAGVKNAVSAADIEAERQKIQDKVRFLRYEPVIKLSVGYKF